MFHQARLLLLSIALFGTLFFGAFFQFSSPQAYAATGHRASITVTDSLTSSPVNFASLQKTCARLLIHLNGAQHSISCAEARTSAGTVQPHLYADYCGNPVDVTTISILNYNETGLLCFYGTGYLGVQIYQVNQVNAYYYSAWMRFYPPGAFCSLNAGGDSTNFGGNEITQLNSGSTGGYQHC